MGITRDKRIEGGRRRRGTRVLASILIGLSSATTTAFAAPESSEAHRRLRPAYRPAWDRVPATRVLSLDFDRGQSDTANGDRFKDAVLALQPGDLLEVSAGRWSVNSYFQVDVQGTAGAPIRIVGAPGAVLTRPNAGQNTINFGSPSGAPTRYLLLRGFEVDGGSYGIRIQDAEHLWLDQCHVHDTAATGIGANSHDTSHLTITRCEIERTANTGEGIYLGANGGAVICQSAVIALNHIHDTGGSQGDGIELKQGSHSSLIAENRIHDTPYPGIIVYGTGGAPVNVVEGNEIWNTAANPFQVQGDAIVRNNLVFSSSGPALQSGPHQDLTQRLVMVGNTFFSTGADAAFLQAWNNRPGMVLANNVFYCQSGEALHVSGGLNGVSVGGNVVLGPIWGASSAGFTQGQGLGDFVDVTWDGARRDARPSSSASALYGTPVPVPGWSRDLTGATRIHAASVGAMEAGTYGRYFGGESSLGPFIRARSPLVAGGQAYGVTIDGAPAFGSVLAVATPVMESGTSLGSSAPMAVLGLVANGNGQVLFEVPRSSLPGTAGDRIEIHAGFRDPQAPGGIRWGKRMIARAQ